MPPCDKNSISGNIIIIISFNPCFSGCRPATLFVYNEDYLDNLVSILVLVDAALRHLQHYSHSQSYLVSILVLVDAALRRDINATTCCMSI